MFPNITSDVCLKAALYFYSPTECLVGNIGRDDNRGCWRGNNISAKQEKRCKNRFDDVETGIFQINGNTDGGAICREVRKNTEQVYGPVLPCCVNRDKPLNSPWLLLEIQNIGLDNL